MSDKIPLILFSGGLDSTYLLVEQLKNGPADVLYTAGPQGNAKVEAETRARKNIIELIENKPELHKVRMFINGPVFYNNEMVDPFLMQPMTWIYSALMVVNHELHSEVQIGYILGDQALAFRHEIEQAWNGLSAISKLHHVPIRFPLVKRLKTDIYKELDSDIRDELWHCEIPIMAWPDSEISWNERRYSSSLSFDNKGNLSNDDLRFNNAHYRPCGVCVSCITARNVRESLGLVRLIEDNPVVGEDDTIDKFLKG